MPDVGREAGDFNQRITIQQKSVTRAANGEEIVTWQDVSVGVPAIVNPLRGNELFAAAQMQDASDHLVTIRYRPGIVREMRVLWRGDPLDIVSVIDVKAARVNLELMCIQGVRNGR